MVGEHLLARSIKATDASIVWGQPSGCDVRSMRCYDETQRRAEQTPFKERCTLAEPILVWHRGSWTSINCRCWAKKSMDQGPGCGHPEANTRTHAHTHANLGRTSEKAKIESRRRRRRATTIWPHWSLKHCFTPTFRTVRRRCSACQEAPWAKAASTTQGLDNCAGRDWLVQPAIAKLTRTHTLATTPLLRFHFPLPRFGELGSRRP